MKPLRPTLAQKLKQCRKDIGLTQPEVAERIGIQRFQSVSNWENGRAAPEMHNLEKLAVLYEKPVGYFLDQGIDLAAPAVKSTAVDSRVIDEIKAAAREGALDSGKHLTDEEWVLLNGFRHKAEAPDMALALYFSTGKPEFARRFRQYLDRKISFQKQQTADRLRILLEILDEKVD